MKYASILLILMTLLAGCSPASVVINQAVTTTPASSPISEQDSDPVDEQTVIFTASNKNFPNPERGWFHSISPDYATDANAPALDEKQVTSLRDNNITLVRKYYLLTVYRNKPIGPEVLALVKSDAAVARKAGIKLIMRFTYTWNKDLLDDAGQDAALTSVLMHIDQLGPVLAENADVIDHLEAGFVGLWAEWHDSSNGLVNADLTANDASRQIIDKLLAVLPRDRMIVLRYPATIMSLYSEPVNPQDAYTGKPQARIGWHNDGFLYDETDFGTYSNAILKQKEYEAAQTQYTLMSGEPAGEGEYPLSVDPFDDLERFHWSSMNIEQGDSANLYATWKKEGVFDEISRRLGYRFSLVQATLPKAIHPGATLQLSFDIRNDGFAGLHNPRPVEIVLRNIANQTEYFVTLPDDPRFWQPGQTSKVNVNAVLPANIPAEEYKVFLNLPDPARELYGRQEFSIRLANENTWEASSGYNSMQASIQIAPSAPGQVLEASLTFSSREILPKMQNGNLAETPVITDPVRKEVDVVGPTPETIHQGDILINFQDRPGQETALTGVYQGLDFGVDQWITMDEGGAKYLVPAIHNKEATLKIILPEGKVLKVLALRKLQRTGFDSVSIRSQANEEHSRESISTWFALHSTGWRVPSQTVEIVLKSDSPNGVANIQIDNLLIGDPPVPDKILGFGDIQLENGKQVALKGLINEIDFGSDGWIVENNGVSQYLVMDSKEAEKTLTISLPDGWIFRGISMQVKEDKSTNMISFSTPDGNSQAWSWFPVGSWMSEYETSWETGTRQLTITIQSTSPFGVGNVMIEFFRLQAP